MIQAVVLLSRARANTHIRLESAAVAATALVTAIAAATAVAVATVAVAVAVAEVNDTPKGALVPVKTGLFQADALALEASSVRRLASRRTARSIAQRVDLIPRCRREPAYQHAREQKGQKAQAASDGSLIASDRS